MNATNAAPDTGFPDTPELPFSNSWANSTALYGIGTSDGPVAPGGSTKLSDADTWGGSTASANFGTESDFVSSVGSTALGDSGTSGSFDSEALTVNIALILPNTRILSLLRV
jgi:hypothetical protein